MKMRGLKEKSTSSIVPLTAAEPSAPALLQAMPDAVLCAGASGRVIFSNHKAQAFFGMGENPLGEKTLVELLGISSPALEALGQGRAVMLRNVTVGGRPVNSLYGAPLADGQVLVVISHDTVKVKTAWAEKLKNSIKPAQHLARMLAHEIKNPLSGISGAAQLLSKSDLKPDDRELAELIGSETQRILRLVEKVMVFDDAPQHGFEDVNIHAVLDHVEKLALQGFAQKVSFDKRYDPSLPPIHGHFDLLVQAVLNLVKNAAEAAPEKGGKITLHTFYDTTPAFHPESHERLPICIAIEDNGAGIDAETQKRLFEPYFTNKPKGEGLGLSIVSKIVDDHGGAVDVISVPGKTLFRISFPRSKT